MAWLTKIVADEQVEYRLKEQAGCAVVELDEAQTVVRDEVQDQAVDYRLRPEGGAALVWMGAGLKDVGLVEGAVLDEEGKAAARRLMSGCHPQTGARLITSRTSVRAHEQAQLTTARVVEAVEQAAAEKGIPVGELFAEKPKQLRTFQAQQRNVHRFGERHRMQVGTLHKLARAAGLSLEDLYGQEELADAWAHKDLRVDDRVRGWDLVLDLPKSDSVLDGLMQGLGEEQLRELVHQAKRDTFDQLERWVAYGVGSEDGQPVRLATGGLMAWSVEHQSARPIRAGEPGDPHLHLHVTIANMALCEDGQWRSIANSGQDLHRHASAADAYFKARVRSLTYEHFGVRREHNARTGAWEVVGIPEQLRDAFSRRAALVDERAGADASRREKAAVSAATKRDKLDVDADSMRDSWRQRAQAVIGDVDAMVAGAAPGPPGPGGGAVLGGPGAGPRIPPPSDIAAIVFDPKTGLTASDKTFSRAQLLAAVANSLEYGISADPESLEQLADDVLAIEGYAVRVPTVGSTVMSSLDRYTTQDILEAEHFVRQEALDRYDSGVAQLGVDQAAAAVDVFQVAAGFELSAEQRAAVTRILTAGHGVDTLVGVAGAGKSTLMDACRIGWDATGTTYAGATLAAVAAKQLHDASGIPARTVASWLTDIEGGSGLRGVDVLVVDEATMVDDRAAAVLMAEAARTGTKLVGIGDPLQLQAIGPGGWFREVHRIMRGLTLTENRRQEDAAERAALEVWRTGDHQGALRMLAAGGRIHSTETADEARSQILMTWDQLRSQQWTDPHDLIDNLVVLAARNADVDALNLGAQQIRRAAGELGDEHTYAQPGGHALTLAVGDVVRIRANDYRSRRGQGPDMLNGYRAVVTAMDEHHSVELTWRVKDSKAAGGVRTESAWVKPDKIASGALSLGYAMTVAASQGLTCNTSLMYGHGANAFATYPGITRARRQNHLWLPLAVVEDEQTQARLGAARSEKERLERAVDAFAHFLGQSRPDHMVSDLLQEPPAPAPLPQQRDLSAEEAQAEARRLRQEELARVARLKSTTVRRPPADEEGPRLTEEHLDKLRRLQEERDVPPWTDRKFGALTDRKLGVTIAENQRHARNCDGLATQAEEKLRAHTERLERAEAAGQTRGQAHAAEAGQLLDRATQMLGTAYTELHTASQYKRTAEERTDWLGDLSRANGKSWLALRMAGTSRTEHRNLTQQYTAERAAAWTEESRAGIAARETVKDAWNLLRESRFADSLSANKPPPGDVNVVAQVLEEMRSTASRTGHNIDVHDQQRVGHLQKDLDSHRQTAQSFRSRAESAQAEKLRRQTISERFPALHTREAQQRQELNQQRLAEHRRRQQQAAAYTPQQLPPTAGRDRGGPSLGM